MHDLDRIEQLLATQALDPARFERFAQDKLSELYPDLVPIPGGADWGRDAEILKGRNEERTGMLATTSRDLDGVRANMLRGIASMTSHGVATRRIVLVNPGSFGQVDRDRLIKSAKTKGFELDQVFDRSFLASKLRRDGFWRKELLGLSSEPISLAPIAPDLAESPWRNLPLVARAADLTAIQGIDGDLIVTGPPGVGKTRLLQELSNAAFIDRDAGFDQVFDDLRWYAPGVVVVDDAGGADPLIARLLFARGAEPDVFGYRVVAVCWPDELDQVRARLGGASTHELSLLERSDIDALVVSMGITNELARAEILGQAEGRPGWAVTLGDLLLRAQDPSSLLRGKALFGEVTKYLQRAGLSPETVNVLTLVAALGGIHDHEIAGAAHELGVSRGEFAGLLTSAARSGLIDVETRFLAETSKNVRWYQVRPPMLADVLVAEKVFASEVPAFDPEDLAGRWASHLGELAEAVIDAVLLGQVEGAPLAERLFDIALASDVVTAVRKNALATRLARIDHSYARKIVQLLRTSFDEWVTSGDIEPWRIEPALSTASSIAGWYLDEDAVRLLLDAALLDARDTNPNPGHPLRKLSDLVHDFHPELTPPSEHRDLIGRVADEWVEQDPDNSGRWRVFGEQVTNVLGLELSSARNAPGSPRTFQLIQTIVDATEIERIYLEVWPRLRDRLTTGPPEPLARVLDVVQDWLRIGGGYDQPFGNPHPQDRIAAAKESGEALLRDLAQLSKGSPGLEAAVRAAAERFDVAIDLPVAGDAAAFFQDFDRRSDWEAAHAELRLAIRSAIARWPETEPDDVLPRLRQLRHELELAGLNWPDRVIVACQEIAADAIDPLEWVDRALELDLGAEAGPFIDRAQALGQPLGVARLDALLGDGRARSVTLARVLAAGVWSDRNRVIAQVQPIDFGVLHGCFLRHELDDGTVRRLLRDGAESSRACVAAAMFYERGSEGDDWTPDESVKEDWLAAISLLDMNAVPGFFGWEAGRLTSLLARRYPTTLNAILERQFQAAIDAEDFSNVLPHEAWDELHQLPGENKTALWERFAVRPVLRWLFMQHLVGTDEQWLADSVEQGRVTPSEALSAYSGFGPHLSMEQLARLLVPRGVDPREVAALAYAGSWVGEQSEHYAELVQQFEALAGSDDPPVAAVGVAGVDIFSKERSKAEEDEHRQRVRGES